MVIGKEVTMANLAYYPKTFHRETEEEHKKSDTASIIRAEVRLLGSGSTYNSTQCYYTEDHHRHLHCHENFKSHSVMISKF
jgi:DNA polymerase II large subunit